MPDERASAGDPTLEHRWWVDTGKVRQPQHRGGAPTLIGARFFDIGYEFEQEQAKMRLTDINLKFLEQTRPAAGEWALLRTVPNERLPEAAIARVKERVGLPAGARGLIIDSGHAARIILTGEPVGEAVLEFTLGESSSFDCWVNGEWMREELFASEADALAQAAPLVRTYLDTQQPQAV